MTQEEKAKAYDEAVKRVETMKAGECKTTFMFTEGLLEYIFPELAESDDEKIRKALIEMVHDTTGDSLWVDYDVHKEGALAWLEKQVQKPQGKSALEAASEEKVNNQNCVKPTDKVESKFKVGDKVIGIISGIQYYIIEVCDNHYRTESGCIIMFGAQDNFELVEQQLKKIEQKPTDEEIKELLRTEYEKGRADAIAEEKERILGKLEEWLDEYISNLADVGTDTLIGSFRKYLDGKLPVKSKSQWEPSEGQLECLGYAIEKAEKDWSPLTNNRIYLTLKALKEQLLELRGSKV